MLISNRTILKLLLAGLTLSLSACLEVSSKTDEAPSTGTNNNDFSVITEPDTQEPTVPDDNGGPVPGDTTKQPDDNIVGFLINQGAARTASTNLQLDFYPPFYAAVMKVSEGKTCNGGSWVEIVPSDIFNSSLKNQVIDLSVQYIDNDQRVSPCYTQSIAIDQIGPDILFNKYPTQNIEAGKSVEIVFTVTDALSEVTEVLCSFQGVQKTCAKGTNTLQIPSIAEGSYTVSVSAKDSLGNSSQKSVQWQVVSLYKHLSQKITVKENHSVDILMVIDNSGSMEYEQKSMASRTSKFLEVLRGLDYQIAITTTDPVSSTWGDGRFLPLKGASNQYIINSSMNEGTAQTLLSNTLQRTETGSGAEQGIFAATRVVERAAASPSSMYGGFFRTGAQFAVLVITDEDESANGTKNNPQNLLSLIQQQFSGNKAFSFHSIITRPGDKNCINTRGYSYGYRYAEFSNLTGGVIGDVCASDYTAQVQDVAQGVRKTLNTLTLTCTPIVDSYYNVVVMKDGVEFQAPRTLSGLNLVFNDMLTAGNYEVLYTCLK